MNRSFSQVFSYLTWFILLLLAVPTFLVLSSWNALPGDSLYAVKRGLEDVLLTLVSPSQNLSSNLSIKYSERRFIEATSLISEKHSIVGLASFEQQVQTTQEKIQSTTDPKTQQDLKDQLVSNLQTYNQQLEETKAQVTTSNTNNIAVTQTPATPVAVVVTATPTTHTETEITKGIVTETPVVTVVPVVVTASNTVQPATNAQIVAAINQTQEHITKTIKELENNNQENSHQDNKQQNDIGRQKEHKKNKGD